MAATIALFLSTAALLPGGTRLAHWPDGALLAHRDRTVAPQMFFESLFGGATPKQPTSSSSSAREEPQGDGRAQAAALGLQLPLYDVLASGDDFEVRRYQRLAVVECEYEKRPEGYELLGGYCAGETAAGLPMPKTAPCVMRPTASPKTMWYILPNPHTPLDPADAPVPPPVRRAL
eukprot:scaffold5597_cov105-Isochrysis_galbana.AAC.6